MYLNGWFKNNWNLRVVINVRGVKDYEKDYSLIIKDGFFWVYDKVEMECVCIYIL